MRIWLVREEQPLDVCGLFAEKPIGRWKYFVAPPRRKLYRRKLNLLSPSFTEQLFEHQSESLRGVLENQMIVTAALR